MERRWKTARRWKAWQRRWRMRRTRWWLHPMQQWWVVHQRGPWMGEPWRCVPPVPRQSFREVFFVSAPVHIYPAVWIVRSHVLYVHTWKWYAAMVHCVIRKSVDVKWFSHEWWCQLDSFVIGSSCTIRPLACFPQPAFIIGSRTCFPILSCN